jgi:conjugative relaxase-like TrwC/TraI family protein
MRNGRNERFFFFPTVPFSMRRSLDEFQCGAPKSVSVMALVVGDERLRTAHAESVKVALRELECFAACRGKESIGRLKRHEFTGEICAALFEHDTSRSLDPQLYTHCVVANATWDKSRSRWSALTEFEMVQAIRYVGKVYQNELASRVKALGYGIRDDRPRNRAVHNCTANPSGPVAGTGSIDLKLPVPASLPH